MTKNPIAIIYKESLAQSIVSDISTFGFLLLCIWASWGSTGWTFLAACLFLIFFVSKMTMFTNDATLKVYSLDELQSWIDGQREKQK